MYIRTYVMYYTGMLSKSKGQILRVVATLHVLFHIETPLAIPNVIGVDAVEAAIDEQIHKMFVHGNWKHVWQSYRTGKLDDRYTS